MRRRGEFRVASSFVDQHMGRLLSAETRSAAREACGELRIRSIAKIATMSRRGAVMRALRRFARLREWTPATLAQVCANRPSIRSSAERALDSFVSGTWPDTRHHGSPNAGRTPTTTL